MSTIPIETAKRYLQDEWHSVRAKGDHVITCFLVEDHDCDPDGTDGGSGWLASLLPLRTDMAAGDLRALYLAWLGTAQGETLPDDALEPPVPAGLAELTGPL